MYLFSQTNFTTGRFLSFLLALMPVSFVAGNMIININILLIIVASLTIYRGDVFKLKYFLLDKIIFSFFVLILITGLLNEYYFFVNNLSPWLGYFKITLKSFLFLKYLLFYIVLRFLIEKEKIDLKIFFLSCLIITLFVCFDIFYQFIFGKDIFGYKIIGSGQKLSGPFGDELIAGGYIQRFAIFSFFVLPLFYPDKNKKYSKYLLPILFSIFFVGIILSGNRMPLILFLLSVIMILIFQKQTRKYFLHFMFIISLIFLIMFNSNSTVNQNFKSFYHHVTTMLNVTISGDVMNKRNLKPHLYPQHLKEFSTFYDTWLMNKYIGGGIKNFRYYCHKASKKDKKKSNFVCNMHPHNYYLEILTETGILGFSIVMVMFSIILYISFIKKYFYKYSSLKDNNLIIPFLFLFIVEIFPIKSTGSFFTTGNTTYLFLLIGILVAFSRKQNLIEKNY